MNSLFILYVMRGLLLFGFLGESTLGDLVFELVRDLLLSESRPCNLFTAVFSGRVTTGSALS